MDVRKAVIPVAGLGTRLLPATKAIPKELVPVVSKPAVQWVVEAAVASGIEEIVFITSDGKEGIERHFAPDPSLEEALVERGKTELLEAVRHSSTLVRVSTVRQAEPLGLGHAVLQAREAVGDEPFAVILPDELVLGDPPALAQCLETARATAGSVIGIVEVEQHEVRRYGIVDIEPREDHPHEPRIIGLVEKPEPAEAPSRLAITGPYVLGPEAFDAIAGVTPGSGGEIQLTDALRTLARSGPVHGRLIAGARLDVGHPLGFVQANVSLGLVDPAIGTELRSWLREQLSD